MTLSSIPRVLGDAKIKEMSGLGMRQTAMSELGSRLAWGNGSTRRSKGFVITWEELSRFGGMGLTWIVCRIRDAAARGWECPVQPTCVLIDGYKMSGGSGGFDAYTADDVEMVELYFPVPPTRFTGSSINSRTKLSPEEQQERMITSSFKTTLDTRGCKSDVDTTAVIWQR